MAEPDLPSPVHMLDVDLPADLLEGLPVRRRATIRRLAALAEPTSRLRSGTAFAFWTLAGGGARRALDPAALTPAQRLVFLAAAHHADLFPDTPITAVDVANLTALPEQQAQAALRRLARRGWLRTTAQAAADAAHGYGMPAAARAFVHDGVLEDPRLLGEPLIEILADDNGPTHN